MNKVISRVQKRDGLPKTCSVDAWLEAFRKNDQKPLLGGIVWWNNTLGVAARIKGKILVLPFSSFTGENPFRSALNEKDRDAYDKLRADAAAGAFDKWVTEKRKEMGDTLGF